MANTLQVFEHGDESLLKLQLDNGAGVGAWLSPSNWDFSDPAFESGFRLYADGVEVENVRILARTDTSNPQAAVLWPHVTDNDHGTVGNTLEFWLGHDYIDRDAVVTFSIDEDVATQGMFGNAASTNQAADEQLSTYKADWMDHVADDATGVFLSHDIGTLPKFPYLERNLGSPTASFASGADIPAASINGTQKALFAIDITIEEYGGTGVVFEYGDSSNGISAFFNSGQLFVKVGDSTNAVTYSRTNTNVGYFPIRQSMTLGVYVDPVLGSLEVYVEGMKIHNTVSGTIGNFTSAADGRVGSVNGDYMQSDTIPSPPATSDLTIDSSLRYYQDPTLDIGIDGSNSKDFFPLSYNTTVRDVYEGQPWESEITKYEYVAGDIADLRDPGAINYLRSQEAARGLMQWATAGSADPTAKHCFVGVRSGETWGTTRHDYSGVIPYTYAGLLEFSVQGESKSRGFVLFRFGGDSIIHFDWSSPPADASNLPGVLELRKKSCIFSEERIFEFTGNVNIDGLGMDFSVSGSGTAMHTWRIGGMRFNNLASNGITYVDNSSIASNAQIYGHTWGEMCFNDVGADYFRSAAISTGAADENGRMQRVQFGQGYMRNAYAGTGGDGLQAHGVYIKGWVPYLRFKPYYHAGVQPGGPGGMKKLDTHKKMIVESVVGWKHQSGGQGFQNNGTNNGVIWPATTDRSRNAGRHNDHCLIRDFVMASCDDFLSGIASAVDCELRDGIITGPGHDLLFIFRDTGNSNTEGEYGGDSYNSGYNRVTFVGQTPGKVRIASTDDRTQNNSQAHHQAYLWRCLIASSSGAAIGFESWTNPTQGYTAGASAGRISEFLVGRSHILGDITENGVAFANLAAARSGMQDGGTPVFDDDCQEGSVTFANLATMDTDPLLAHFLSLGYADYTEVAEALVDAWEGGWDTVPEGLAIPDIVAAVAARVRPTNLLAEDYGGEVPGYPSEASSTAPSLSAALVGGGALTDGASTSLGSTEEDSDLSGQVTITNDGDADLDLGTLVASGSLTIDAGDNPSGLTIAPGESDTVTVIASAASVGAQTGSLSIPSNDASSPFDQTFTWTVTEAQPLRSSTIGLCPQDGTLSNVTVRAPSSMSGEFRVAVRRANGDIVQSGLTLILDSSTLISGSVPGGLSVSKGDELIIQTMSAAPDQSGMRALFEVVPG